MRSIQVFFSDGDHLVTSINGSDGDILEHYLGHRFEAGSDTEYHVAILVKFLDTGAARGLRLKNIESGAHPPSPEGQQTQYGSAAGRCAGR